MATCAIRRVARVVVLDGGFRARDQSVALSGTSRMDALESQDLLNDLLDKHANTGVAKPEDAETLEHLLANNTSGLDGNSSLRGLSGSALLQLLVGRFGLDAKMANNLVAACTTGDVLATYGEADFAKCGIDIVDPKLELLKQVFVDQMICTAQMFPLSFDRVY